MNSPLEPEGATVDRNQTPTFCSAGPSRRLNRRCFFAQSARNHGPGLLGGHWALEITPHGGVRAPKKAFEKQLSVLLSRIAKHGWPINLIT